MAQRQFADFWIQTKWSRYAFVAGLLIGIFLGWFFHGVVSFVWRFFFVLLLLVPLVVVAIGWYRISRRRNKAVTTTDEVVIYPAPRRDRDRFREE
ncbi:MAG: hypothetical protein M3Q71_18105 [Chloroflexota bacterium]|nr:hypothetical protein [Chloroflexota bacterium]